MRIARLADPFVVSFVAIVLAVEGMGFRRLHGVRPARSTHGKQVREAENLLRALGSVGLQRPDVSVEKQGLMIH